MSSIFFEPSFRSSSYPITPELPESFTNFVEFRDEVEMMELVGLEQLEGALHQEYLAKKALLGAQVEAFSKLELDLNVKSIEKKYDFVHRAFEKLRELVQQRYEKPEQFAIRFQRVKELAHDSSHFTKIRYQNLITSTRFSQFVKKIECTDLTKLFIDHINQKYKLEIIPGIFNGCIIAFAKENQNTFNLKWNKYTAIKFSCHRDRIFQESKNAFLNFVEDSATNVICGMGCGSVMPDSVYRDPPTPVMKYSPAILSACLFPFLQTVRVLEKRDEWIKKALQIIHETPAGTTSLSKDVAGIVSLFCIDPKSLPETIQEIHEEVGEEFNHTPDVIFIRSGCTSPFPYNLTLTSGFKGDRS